MSRGDFRVNERIRAREVRLIDDAGTQVGVVPFRQAIELAREKGLDLIEVAPTANPPVCRIMDYGKWKYEQGKRERDAHKKQKASEVKGIRMRPGIDEHDFQFKLKNALKFLKEGDKVKFTVIFRSREITHPEFARKSLQRIAEESQEIAVVEKAPSMEGRTMTMILSPKSAV
ncbi:MAG: translation initiation factor IF-3 [Armatimonadota bacterium]